MNYDDFGARLRAAYDVYVLSITGTYLSFRAAGRSTDAVTEMRQKGTGMHRALHNSASMLMGEYLRLLPDGPGEDERSTYFLGELERIATKNLNELIIRLMGLGVQRAADVLTQPAGAVGLLLQQKLSRPHFTARDRAGRVWDASKLVSVIARDFAYQAYVDVMLARQMAAGADKIDIVYADPERNHALTIQEAFDRRAEIFHVNATARIQSHVPT